MKMKYLCGFGCRNMEVCILSVVRIKLPLPVTLEVNGVDDYESSE